MRRDNKAEAYHTTRTAPRLRTARLRDTGPMPILPLPPVLPEDDDAALFRAAIGPVRVLPPAPSPPSPPPPRAEANMREQDDRRAWDEFRRSLKSGAGVDAEEGLCYRRDILPPHLLQRLARGQYAVQDELDLCHARAARAEEMLGEFLHAAHRHGYRCVRIIHAKGRGSARGMAVLQPLLEQMLRRRAEVLAFHSAPVRQGGTDAVLVLLGT